MHKIYPFKHSEWSRIKHGHIIQPMSEDLWFKAHQRLLLKIVNTNEGRDLLCIDQDLPQIYEIGKNYVKGYLGQQNGLHYSLSDFRVGAKWANVIRFRWQDFTKYAKRFYDNPRRSLTQIELDQRLLWAATTSTFFPDPHPENTSVDGWAGWGVSGGSGPPWASARGAAGNQSDDTGVANGVRFAVLADTTPSGDWRDFKRGIILIDVSVIDEDVKDSAILSFFGDLKIDSYSADMVIVSANPASNTAIVDADGTITNFGSTEFTDSRKTLAAFSDSGYNDFELNDAGLATVSGVVPFGWLSGADFDNVEPTWVSNMQDICTAIGAEAEGTSTDIKLVVIHTSAFIPKIIFM